MKKKILIIIGLVILGIAIIAEGIFLFFVYKEENEADNSQESKAMAYYRANSQILSTTNVKDAKEVKSEQEIIEIYKDLGFIQYEITYDYSINGKFVDEQTVSEDSEEKHPSYRTLYVSKNNILWSIIIMNGSIVANPVSFNTESDLDAQLVLAEDNAINCYDSETNCFIKAILNESELIIQKVDKIDADTLDDITTEELAKQ